jgi:8-oxo-dGTP pyrophosphatase MutT (NUDIX family)
VAREAREETGIDAGLGRLVGVYSRPGQRIVLIVSGAEGQGERRSRTHAPPAARP